MDGQEEDIEIPLSLSQIDPLPIPDSRPGSISLPPATPLPPKRSSTFPLGLSGSGGHSSVYYLTRLQRYSSYIFSIYTTFHITNTSLIPLVTRSVSASEPYLLLTRPYYQSFPLEPLLITLPIATHILAGLALRINRRNANLARYGANNVAISDRLAQRLKVWPPLSWGSLSGYALTPLVLGHAAINRILPWVYEGGSSGVGLGFVSHGFARHPFLATTGYLALVGVAAGHMVWGVAKWQGWIYGGDEKKTRRRWWVINGVAVAVATLWGAGGLGVVGRGGAAEGWVGKGYDMLYEKIPLLGL